MQVCSTGPLDLRTLADDRQLTVTYLKEEAVLTCLWVPLLGDWREREREREVMNTTP